MDPETPRSTVDLDGVLLDDVLLESDAAERVAALLPPEAARRFRALHRPPPTVEEWRAFLSVLLLAAGTLLAAAAVIFFFAANWQGLDRFAKLGILATGFTAASVGAWRAGLDTAVGRAAQIVATALLGTFLAVFGQIYQTGADDWRLFALWAALLLPWTGISRWSLPWLIQAALIHLATMLLVVQVFAPKGDGVTPLVSAAVTGAIWAAWEWTARGPAPFLGDRLGPRVAAVATYAALIPTSISVVMWKRDDPSASAALVGLALLSAFGIFAYRRWVARDVFVPAIALGSAITVFTAFLAELLEGSGFTLLLLGLVLVAEISLATWWLRTLHQQDQQGRKNQEGNP